MKEAMEVFYDPKFKVKLDADPYLIAFKNGVYDLRVSFIPGKKDISPLRIGRPEDYLSKSLPINYVEYTEDNEKVQEIYSFLEIEPYSHDFNNIVDPEDDSKVSDSMLGLPENLHKVEKSLIDSKINPYEILSDYAINKYSNLEFWRN